MTQHTATIDIQPAALLVRAPGDTTIHALNQALAAHGLCLPVEPLETGLTLSAAIERNAGGRRQLAYGTIARYIRAATVQPPDEQAAPLHIGGPTLKRATGYGLPRALVGGDVLRLGRLQDVMLNVRPLPPARHELFIVCDDMPAACCLAAQMLASGAALSALAVINDTGLRDAHEDDTDWYTERHIANLAHKTKLPSKPAGAPKDEAALLVELEGTHTVLDRQARQLTAMAEQSGGFIATSNRCETAQPYASEWASWEELAEQWFAAAVASDSEPRLAFNLPRAALPAFTEQASSLAQRYSIDLHMWGDAGVGSLHLRCVADPSRNGRSAGEIGQAAALIRHLAHSLGGAITTDQPLDAAEREAAAARVRVAALPPANGTDSAALLAQVRQVVGNDYVLTRPGELLCYAADASIAPATGEPLAVVLPGSTEEVSAVMRSAAAAGVPVVTRGAGSGLAGGATPSAGALLLSLTRMQHFTLDAAQQVVHAQAGAITAQIQKAADQQGLFYAPDPSSQNVSTIGGNIACNAGGPRCLKYGVTSHYVLGLTVVLADGRSVRLGDGIAAQSPDVGLLNVMIGSEGTLGIVTEATLGLLRTPAARRTTLAFFERLDDACATVETIMASGILPAGLELMDDTSIQVVEDAMQLGLPRDVEALLLLLSDGEPETVEWEAGQLAAMAQRGGARSVQVAQNASDEAAFWRARRSVSPSFARVRPNKLGEDICVPLPQIAHTVRQVKAIAQRHGLPIPVFGHAGDGNLHPNILFDARNKAEVTRAWRAAEEIFMVALDCGGTLSGEHGIGTLKRPFLGLALGEDVLARHRSIKAHFDPQGLLNPGKVL